MKAAATFLLIAISMSGMAQSLQEKIVEADTTESDSLRALRYARISMQYRRSNPDSGFYFASKALNLANEIQIKPVKASAHNVFGNLFFFRSDYDSALHHYGICYNIAAETRDTLRLGAMLNNIGQVNTYKGNYDTAVHILLLARTMYAVADSSRVASATNNIGNAYYKMNDFDRALKYYREAAELKKKFGQRLSLSNSLNNIGIILKEQGKYEEAIPYYEESLEIAEEFNDKIKLANAHNNLSALYEDGPKDYEKSEYHVLRSISLKREMGDKAGLYNSYNNYASLLSTTNRFREALLSIEKAEALKEDIGETMYETDGLLLKSSVLRDLGRYKEAYEVYRKAYASMVDEVNTDRNDKIAEWETKFETAQKEAEIEKLSLESDLQQAHLNRSRTVLIAVLVSSILLFAFLFLFFSQRSKKQKAENEAQELQLEALKKRFIELHSSPSELAVKLELGDLNEKLHTPLTDREFDALKLSIEGKSNTEIANELFISVSTVKFHLRNTYSKMGVGNRKEAFQYMLKTS